MCLLVTKCLMPDAEIAKDLLAKIWDEGKKTSLEN